MYPLGSTRKNHLKRPRLATPEGELEIHRPPRKLRDASGTKVKPDMKLEELGSGPPVMGPVATNPCIASGQGHASNPDKVTNGLRDPLADTKRPADVRPSFDYLSQQSKIPTTNLSEGPTGAPPLWRPLNPSMPFGKTSSGPTQAYITGGNHFENYGTLNFYQQTDAHDLAVPTELCRHASPNAIHTSSAVDNQGICMPGTRAFTLQRLQSLVASAANDEPDIVWMHGPAGAGKSAIMRTMANALEEQEVLLGSFFFFRSDSTRNTLSPFLPTMALQSFTSLPAIRQHIRDVVESQPTLFSQSIRHQLRILLETPLKLVAGHEPQWGTQSPLVLVIDGLDECADADRQVEIIRAMHQLASSIRASTNYRIKVLIASRPEMPIKAEFEQSGNPTTIIGLDPSDANIDLFYDTRLDEIRRRKNIPESWPSLIQITWLKENTYGQYSFAHISMAFLAGGDPVERLKMLEDGVATHGLEPFGALDALYATVFRQVPPEMQQNALLVVHLLERRRWYDLSFNRLLDRILSLPPGYSSRVLPYLSSILDGDNYFRPFHTSLGDFLVDPLRSKKYSLFLDSGALSTAVFTGLLNLCVPSSMTPMPIYKQTAGFRVDDYETLYTFIRTWSIFPYDRPLPNMTTTLDQLLSLLPTMDIYAFGYCNVFLSTLFRHLQTRSVASDASCLRIVGQLLNQIRSIQHVRFGAYEALEAKGDSGLALFGLLAVFVSDSYIPLEDSNSCGSYGVEEVVVYLVLPNQDIDITDFDPMEQSVKQPIPLCGQLSAMIEARSHWPRQHDRWFDPRSLAGAALSSDPVRDNFPKMPQCLSRTIEMFLDLPSQNTRTQRRLSEFLSCQVHATLDPQCDSCMSILKRAQTSVMYAVFNFQCQTEPEHSAVDEDWLIDARVFARCHQFALNYVENVGWNERNLNRCMMYVGERIFYKLKGEKDADASVVNNLRVIVSSLHERRSLHRDAERNRCMICSGDQSAEL